MVNQETRFASPPTYYKKEILGIQKKDKIDSLGLVPTWKQLYKLPRFVISKFPHQSIDANPIRLRLTVSDHLALLQTKALVGTHTGCIHRFGT